MSATEVAAVRPFQVGFPEADLTELRRRIQPTRWPERETVDDDSQGVPLATMRELAAYPDNLIHYNRLDRGGHFAAWEQPRLFSEELRAAFRSLRT
jgi:pimeloyl-ACP methyl ester carboxylesterase